MTAFHLVRHGDYPLLDRVLAGRMPGHGLSETGVAQAGRVAVRLAQERIGAVVNGPLERAQQTAAPIAARLGLTPRIDPGLDEIDFGDWTGLAFDALHARPEWRTWNTCRSTAPVPGGETMLAAQARAMAALAHHSGPEAVVIVSHSDVIKAVLAHVLGVPLDLFGRIEIAPASRSVIVLDEGSPRVLGVNLPPE